MRSSTGWSSRGTPPGLADSSVREILSIKASGMFSLYSGTPLPARVLGRTWMCWNEAQRASAGRTGSTARLARRLGVAKSGGERQRVRRSSEDLQSMQSSAYGIASRRSRGIFLEQRAHTPYFLFSIRAIADSMS